MERLVVFAITITRSSQMVSAIKWRTVLLYFLRSTDRCHGHIASQATEGQTLNIVGLPLLIATDSEPSRSGVSHYSGWQQRLGLKTIYWGAYTDFVGLGVTLFQEGDG